MKTRPSPIMTTNFPWAALRNPAFGKLWFAATDAVPDLIDIAGQLDVADRFVSGYVIKKFLTDLVASRIRIQSL
jgi:hypothetical protein